MRLWLSLLLCFFCADSFAQMQEEQQRLPRQLQHSFELQYSQPRQCMNEAAPYVDELLLALSANKPQQHISKNNRLASLAAVRLYARCAWLAGEQERALNVLHDADRFAEQQQLKIEYSRNQLLLAQLLAKQQHYSEAEQALLNGLRHTLNSSSHYGIDTAINLLMQQAEIFANQQQYIEARQSLEQAESLIVQHNRASFNAQLHYCWGNYYDHIGQSELAITQYSEALFEAEDKEDLLLDAKAAQALSHIYEMQQQHAAAIEYASRAAQAYQQIGHQRSLALVLAHLGSANRNAHQYSAALSHYFNALDVYRQYYPEQLGQLYFDIGQTYLAMDDVNKAREYLNLARSAFRASKENKPQIETQLLLGELSLNQQEYGLAILQLNRAQQQAVQQNYPKLAQRAYYLLSGAYEKANQPEQALAHYKSFHNLYSKQQSNAKENNATQNDSYELAELTQQSTRLQKQLQQSILRVRWLTLFVMAWLIVSVLLTIQLIRSRKALRQSQQHHQRIMQERLHYPFNDLKNYQALQHELPQLMQKEQNAFEHWYHQESDMPQPQRLTLMLFDIPLLSQLMERIGVKEAIKLQKEIAHHLSTRLPQADYLYQLNNHQFLAIVTSEHVDPAQQLANQLIASLRQFRIQESLDRRIAIGIVAHPFLPRSSMALNDEQLLDLLYLSLHAAKQMMQKGGHSVWAELYALDIPQAASLTNDLWIQAQLALQKGLLKLNTNGERNLIQWPLVTRNALTRDDANTYPQA